MLTREETAKVFAMYYGQMFKHDVYTGIIQNNGSVEHSFDNVMDKKIILTDIKNITDEHAVEVAKICGIKPEDIEYMVAQLLGFCRNHDIYYWIDLYRITPKESYSILQYLISKGYAVPLFFGLDHPCNGKTAIECGVAIEKSKNE